MPVLSISSLYLFYPKEEKAKYVVFSDGKNVITSASFDGNNVGKTTILKSIYHTLGADCKFDTMWPTKDIISVLVVNVDGCEYQFYRHDKLHRVYQNSTLIFECSHKHDLSRFMEKQFGLAVYLPNRSGNELELASPAYSYVLNYMDKPTGPYFSSFDGMGEYPSAKETIIYNHLGVFDVQYYNLKKQHEMLTSSKNNAEEKNSILQGMIERISREIVDIDYSSNMEALQKETESISRTYGQLVETLGGIKKNIIALSNQRVVLQDQLDGLRKEQKAISCEMSKMNSSHRCPRCDSLVDDLVMLRSVGYNQQSSIIIMYDELDHQLIELNRKFSKLQDEYQQKLQLLEGYKFQLQRSQHYSNDLVHQEGAIRIRDQFVLEAGSLYQSILELQEKLKATNKELKAYQVRIQELNNEYYSQMKDTFSRFSLKEIDDSKIQRISSSFTPTESNTRIATIIWLYTLLRLKSKYNPEAMVLPILLDSPSFGELDDAKEEELWQFLFALPMPNAQLIITKLDFSDDLQKQYEVDRVIHLDGPKYQMLNSEDYANYVNVLQMLQQNGNDSEQ